MAMSRRNYEAFAEMIADAIVDGELDTRTGERIAKRMASIFQSDNSRFDRNRFLAAVDEYVEEKTDEDEGEESAEFHGMDEEDDD